MKIKNTYLNYLPPEIINIILSDLKKCDKYCNRYYHKSKFKDGICFKCLDHPVKLTFKEFKRYLGYTVCPISDFNGIHIKRPEIPIFVSNRSLVNKRSSVTQTKYCNYCKKIMLLKYFQSKRKPFCEKCNFINRNKHK